MSGIRNQEVVTNSEAETREFAAQLATQLVPGTTILISGDLGAGKTVFVRGLAEGLGLDPDEVTSPTFTLVHEYRGGRLPLVHVDLYRLEKTELDETGLDPDVASKGIMAIEWPDRLTRPVPDALRLQIDDKGGDQRELRLLKPDPS